MGQIRHHEFDNGLVLVAEAVPGAQSLAMSLMTPAGVVAEPADASGMATMLSEMLCRGAGELDAKAHSDALDQLGVQRGTSVETTHVRLSATMIGSKLPEAMPLLADMIRCPMLSEDALEPSRDLALQTLDSLQDEPQQKVFLDLRHRHFPEPFGRSPYGRREDIERISLEQVKDYWRQSVTPGGSILGFAGRFDWDQLRDMVGQLLGDWQGRSTERTPQAAGARGYSHDRADTVQVHIGVAYDAPPEPDSLSIVQRAAAAVLSGGMSGRLFTEVRERHGLCYAVSASYVSNKQLGAMLSYAGTTAPRAQQTFDVLTAELRRLSQGVEADEFERAVVGMKSSLVMQGESTGARANAISIDQYVYGRSRTLDERIAQVDAVTLDQLNSFVRSRPPGEMTVVTIGPEPLAVDGADQGSADRRTS